MRFRMSGCGGIAVLSAFALTCAVQAGETSSKKYVAFAWEFEDATPSNMLAVVDSLDRTPIDGVGLSMRIYARDGKRIRAKLMDQPALEWADLEPWVPVMRELTSHRSMRESMMKSICAPTNRLDWTDDGSWRRVSATMRNIARFAKEGGLKGCWVDDEEYHGQSQYYWCPGDPPYERLCEIVRGRGREVFSAMFSEYPDMTMLFFRFFTRVYQYNNCEDWESARRARGDLWPAFLNGLLDVLPPTAKIVDGFEYGYRFNAESNTYYWGHSMQKGRFVNHVSPENRTKYFGQVSSAAAVYMDMYVNPEGKRWYAPPLNGSRSERFIANVAQATHAVDEYVWFWGEKQCWADWKGKMRQRKSVSTVTWEESLPGISTAMEYFKSPSVFAANRLGNLRKSGKFKPVNLNSKCVKPDKVDSDGLAKPYSCWSDTRYGSAGKYGFDSTFGEDDSSSLFAEGVAHGCFVMSSGKVEPGKIYLVGFSAKGDVVGGNIEWKCGAQWRFSIPGISIPVSEPDANGWRHGLTAIRIPEGADGFGFQLSVRQSAGERSWFDNVFYCPAE